MRGLEPLEDRVLLTVNLQSSYTGLSFLQSTGFVPPDTCGAAGTTSYVETVNQAIAIYTPKDTGTTAVTRTFEDFWFTQGGLPRASATSGLSDPIVVWDDLIQRFIVGDQDVDDTNHVSTFDLAVSKSASPATLTAADWAFLQVNTTQADHDADYPGNFGYNHDAFVFTLNQFPVAGTAATFHVQVTSISITGAPTFGVFQNDIDSVNLRPTVMHDSVAGDPMWLLAEGSGNSINVVKMTNVLSNAATFTTTNLPVNPYSPVVPPLQPVGTAITTTIDSRILKAAEANNTIVASHAISTSATEDDARWYAIDVSGATPTIKDQGNVSAGNNKYIVYPGVDINANGDIGMTFVQSGTGAGQFMSMYVTGRSAADASGVMQTPVLVKAGTANNTDNREGDLSGINVDADGSFWAANEWAAANHSWGTAIAHFSVLPTFGITINDVTHLEGNSGFTDFVFTVTVSPVTVLPITVDYTAVDGTATAANNDYLAQSGTLTFAPGETVKHITVKVVGDTSVEPDEMFFVKLTDAQGGVLARAQGTGIILNDDINATINDITVIESDSGTSNAVFTVSIIGVSHESASVTYVSSDDTANAGSDYVPVAGVLAIPALATSAFITVPIIGDKRNEGTEDFFVNLSDPVGITAITKAIGTCTIIDNDPVPSFYVNDVNITSTQAGIFAAVFTVAVDAASGRNVTVQFKTADGTAHDGVDYTGQSGTLTFLPGVNTVQVTVPIMTTATYSPNERFFLNLSNPDNAKLADPQGTGTIIFAAAPPTEYIVDDGAPGYSQNAGWTNVTNLVAYGLDYDFHAAGNGGGVATWTVGNLPAGSYQIFTKWVAFSNRATNAPYTIFDDTTPLATVLVNQRLSPASDQSNGVTWHSLGTFQFVNGIISVRLTDSANGFVVADAVRIVPNGIPPQVPEIDVSSSAASVASGDSTPSLPEGTEFGDVLSTTDSDIHTFLIANTGNADLHVSGVHLDGANPLDFVVLTQPASVVAPGRTTTFQVLFHPTTTGLRQAEIVVGSDDADESNYTFAIEGNGTSGPVAVPFAQNATLPVDVNNDNRVTPFDALLVINRLMKPATAMAAASSTTSSATASTAKPYYLDVSGDGILSARDALLVINYLMHHPFASGSMSGAAMPNAAVSNAATSNAATPTASVASVATPAVQAFAVDAAVAQLTATPAASAPPPSPTASATQTASASPPASTASILTPVNVRALFASSAPAGSDDERVDPIFG